MLLLDTCALIWLVEDLSALSGNAKKAILQNPDDIYVSAISALEISLLVEKKRLELPSEPFKWYSAAIRLHGLKEIAIDGEIAAMSGKLSPIHKDPCDRIVIATAMLKKLGIVTSDKIFREYKNIKVIW